jgi:hypothetical protein
MRWTRAVALSLSVSFALAFAAAAGNPHAAAAQVNAATPQESQAVAEQSIDAASIGDTGTANTISNNAIAMINTGRRIFRFDTFGDEAFWGGQMRLHQAIEGGRFGGIGFGLSPRMALALGLKVDSRAIPADVAAAIKAGKVNLDDPAVTLMLLKLRAVLGVTGFFKSNGSLQSVGIQCALCHSTVDDSFAPGIGRRLDGWANRDLNIGRIVALSPTVKPFVDVLGVSGDTVRLVLNSWGPGKFDAELVLDGKAFNPRQVSHGVVTGRNVSAATLIPPAFGLAGVNLHTWTGWGSVTHWNAFVANLEMHGKGTFFDPRLDNAEQFPIAAANGFGHVVSDPDKITSKLAALHFYQLAIVAPKPPAGSFDREAAERGDELFSGKAKCNVCHVEPLFTEPGWNMHTPRQIGLDAFQANRAPDHRYRTSPLGGIWTHVNESRRAAGLSPIKQAGFFHDGRFRTLMDVMNHYDQLFNLGLTDQEKRDVVEYMKSLPD